LEKVVLSSQHLANLLDKCISSLESEYNTTCLYDITLLLGFVAKARNDLLSYAIQPFIGMLGPEIDDFLAVTCQLPQNLQVELKENLKSLVARIASSLKRIKEELFERETPDYKSLLEALGEIGKSLSELYEYRDKAEKYLPTYPPFY